MELWRDARGIAALEFALIVPAMVVTSIGIYAVDQGLRVRLLLNTATTSMADLVASQETVTPAVLKDLCSGGIVKSMLPYNTQLVGVTVARYIKPTGAPAAGPSWTQSAACPQAGPAFGPAETSLANSVLVNDGDAVVIAKSTYPFKPSVIYMSPTAGYYVPATTLSVTRYQSARNNGKAACVGC